MTQSGGALPPALRRQRDGCGHLRGSTFLTRDVWGTPLSTSRIATAANNASEPTANHGVALPRTVGQAARGSPHLGSKSCSGRRVAHISKVAVLDASETKSEMHSMTVARPWAKFEGVGSRLGALGPLPNLEAAAERAGMRHARKIEGTVECLGRRKSSHRLGMRLGVAQRWPAVVPKNAVSRIAEA